MKKEKFKFDEEELRREVNLCDKKFGVRLKHPEIWDEPESYRKIFEARGNLNIAALICTLNGIPVEDYFDTDESSMNYGTVCSPIGIKYPIFTKASKLRWGYKDVYNTDSVIFRLRFCTLILTRLLGRIGDVTKYEVYRKDKAKHSFDESRILKTNEVLSDVTRFVNIMISPGNSYQNIILLMNEHVAHTFKKVNQKKLRKILNGHILEIKKAVKKDPLTRKRFASDDMVIWFLLKIAYMLGTNDIDLGDITNFKYLENKTRHDDMKKHIEKLGSLILREGKYKSPMFQAFCEARPSIKTKFHEECKDNVALRTGVLALGYTKFVMNDRFFDKFVDDLLQSSTFKR